MACAGNILRLWRQWAHFQSASKTMRQQAKQTKRTLILDVMHKLEDAAARNDLHQVYTQAKRLAPWKPTSKSHLRGADGQIPSPQEQVMKLQQHSRTKFCKDPPLAPTHRLQASPEITVHDIFHELSTLPMHAAVPPGVAPAAMWRLGVEFAAPLIAEFLACHWAPGTAGDVPHNLKDAFLAWLTKPGKDATRPGGPRPIGLTHPVSKTLCASLRCGIESFPASQRHYAPGPSLPTQKAVVPCLDEPWVS